MFAHTLPGPVTHVRYFSLQDQVDRAETTENIDGPENGFEALAQVITCEDIIGWRSRDGVGDERGLNRVVVFFTDDHFHFSGEGIVSDL